MLSFYQYLSERINPIIFSIGGFDIRWYSIMYLIGFFVVYLLLVYRAEKSEINFKSNIKELSFDFLIYSFFGLIIGARMGYVFFYDFSYFMQNPLAIISPFGISGNFIGIFGMSYFGGLMGIIISSVVFCQRKEIDFFKWADFVVPAIPAGYFFGRIGNFLNGELYGKATDFLWGMYFKNESFLRHPTQLYEAVLEGVLLFAFLWLIRNNTKFKGNFLVIYLFGYGVIRFFIEFLREEEVSYFCFTTGQILALAIILISAIIFIYKNKKSCYNKFDI